MAPMFRSQLALNFLSRNKAARSGEEKFYGSLGKASRGFREIFKIHDFVQNFLSENLIFSGFSGKVKA